MHAHPFMLGRNAGTGLSPFIAADVARSFGLAPHSRVFCENVTQADLEERLINLGSRSSGLVAKADAEGREFTPEEDSEFEDINRTFAATEAQLERLRGSNDIVPRHAVRNASLVGGSLGRGRRTNVEVLDVDDTGRRPTVQALGGRPVTSLVNSTFQSRTGNGGFKSSSEFLSAVILASAKGAQQDPRLISNAAPGQYGSEGSGGDGGFAVPADFRATIMQKVMGEDALLALTDQQQSSSNGITFPADETTPWGTGGIQAYWTAEGGQKTPSKPALAAKSIKLNKVICLVPLTDELLEDAPAMAGYVSRRAPDVITYKVNEAIIRGSGVGTPLGILASPGTVVVQPEAGQATGTVNFLNIMKLWSAILPEARRNARWLLSADVEPMLMTMAFPGAGTAVPAYLPPGGASAAPFGTLLGRPIVYSQALSPLGLQGDIIFGDLRNYLSVTKAGGLQTDVSIHIWFDYDITAFRFVFRVGGEPWWNTPVAPAQTGATSRGFFSTLAARP